MVIVYTSILGGSDSLKPAPKWADRCVCFTDDLELCKGDSLGWTIIVNPTTTDPRREAWRLRCVPQRLFDRYDTAVWIDASFTLTDLPRLLRHASGHEIAGLRHHLRRSCYEEGRELVQIGQSDERAVADQLRSYRQQRFRPTALTISCILVRQHTPAVAAFNDRWLAEIQKHPGDNTQLSLDYCAWKAGLSVHHLRGVRKGNPYATHDHVDHKLRRKPYRMVAA